MRQIVLLIGLSICLAVASDHPIWQNLRARYLGLKTLSGLFTDRDHPDYQRRELSASLQRIRYPLATNDSLARGMNRTGDYGISHCAFDHLKCIGSTHTRFVER